MLFEVLAADVVEPAVEGGAVGPIGEREAQALAARDVEAPLAQLVEEIEADLSAAPDRRAARR